MKNFIMLIGIPASGKSYYRKHISINDLVMISTDDMIDEYALSKSLTYTDAFKKINMKALEKKAFINMDNAVKSGQSIIVDRTNMTKKVRSKFISALTPDYNKIGIVFHIDDEKLEKRLAFRELEGKIIPKIVIDGMKSRFETPTFEEFDMIINVKA